MGVVALVIALCVGLPLLGWVYDPFEPVDDPLNGALTSPAQLVGIMLLMYMGTLGIMVLGNVLPGLVLLRFPLPVYRALLVTAVATTLMGMGLVMTYLIEPQDTFKSSEVTGTVDPIRATAGCFFFFGFGFLGLMATGILIETFPRLRDRLAQGLQWLVQKAAAKKLPGCRVMAYSALYLFLGYLRLHLSWFIFLTACSTNGFASNQLRLTPNDSGSSFPI